MSAPAAEQPNVCAEAPDVEGLRRWMLSMIAAMRFAELVATLVSFLVRVRDLNTELAKKLALKNRKRPPSETLARLGQQLVLELPGVTTRLITPKEKDKKPKRRGKHPGREAPPAHLPRVDVPNPVPAEQRICRVCGSEMKTLKQDVCETLDIRPAELVVLRRLDETVACPHDDTIVSAAPPPELVPRGKLARTFIVESLLDKYVEHQPIERQCTRWERAGVHVASQTLGRSVAIAIDVLGPLAELIGKRTRASALLAADASGLRVLDRDHALGVRTGTVWCWIGDARWVTYVYAAAADAAGFKSFLGEDLARVVQCDGAPVMSCVERAGGKRPGCWAHARRRFVEAAKGGDLDAYRGLEIIAELFAIEHRAADKTADERTARRLEHAVPVLDRIRAWVDDKRGTTPPKTPLGRALGYVHRQWSRLVLFLEDGRLELTNNHVERALRRLVLGRKNWLFVDGDLNGARAASILTIISTCLAQGVDPRRYLHLVTKLIVERASDKGYDDLLPSELAAAHPELRLPAPSRAPPPAPPSADA